MDHAETKLVEDEVEGSAVDFNSANRIRNKTLRRAQVRKDRRQKNKVYVVICVANNYVCAFVLIITSFFLKLFSVLLFGIPDKLWTGQQRNCGLVPHRVKGINYFSPQYPENLWSSEVGFGSLFPWGKASEV
jgi:hypothetical protein